MRAHQAVHAVRTMARVLGVSDRSVRRWVAAARDRGDEALAAVVHPGPKPKLNGTQQRQVLSWLKKPPTEFGFVTELWTAPRVARLIRDRLGVEFHPRYVNAWLTRRGITPQKPETQARERNARRVAAWRGRTWPRLKKKPPKKGPTSS